MQSLCNRTFADEFIAKQLGVEVTMTPKAHPELAGQGIEYSWGYAKLIFRKNNTNGTSKQKAERLAANVRDALSSDNLTIERIRKFVRKARDYKVVYREHFKTLDLMQLSALATTAEDANKIKEQIASFEKLHYSKIEKQVKSLKAHRAAADLDTKFIKES
jgi:DNA-binding transcriptional regulator YhcF (GntR family)